MDGNRPPILTHIMKLQNIKDREEPKILGGKEQFTHEEQQIIRMLPDFSSKTGSQKKMESITFKNLRKICI